MKVGSNIGLAAAGSAGPVSMPLPPYILSISPEMTKVCLNIREKYSQVGTCHLCVIVAHNYAYYVEIGRQ